MHSIGFTMTEPPRNIFFVCFWRKRRTECTPSEVSSPLGARHLHRESAPRILSLLTCWLTRYVCPDGAMRLANSSSDTTSDLFQFWYIRALSIKQEDHILSIEVTAYTSADQPVKHITGNGKVYMDFDTAMEIIDVTVNANRNTGSNTQIMLHVVSLEEELLAHTYLCLICEFDTVLCPSRGYLGLQVQESVHTPLGRCEVTAGNTVAVAFEPAGPGSPPPAWPISGESYRRVPHAETDDVKVFVYGSLRAHSVRVP